MIISGDDSPEYESNRATALAHVPVGSVVTHDFRHGQLPELRRILEHQYGTDSNLAAPVPGCSAGHHGHSPCTRPCEPGPESGLLRKNANCRLVARCLRDLQPCILAHCQSRRKIVASVAEGVSDS